MTTAGRRRVSLIGMVLGRGIGTALWKSLVRRHPGRPSKDVLSVCLWAVPLLILAEVVELGVRASRFDGYDIALSLVGGVITGGLLAFFLPRVEPSHAA